MSVGYLTTDSLISAAKRKAMLPTNQSTFKTEDFLAFANEELKIGIVPSILVLHEEFYVFGENRTIVANKSSYTMPYRALGGRLRDVFYVDTSGNLIEMTRISADDKAIYQNTINNNSYMFYYVEGNSIVLIPSVGLNASGSLLFTYYIRPSDLVEENRVGIIQNIDVDVDAGTTTYTLDIIPTGFSTTTKLDILQANPGHKIRKIDLLANAVSTINKTVTFNTVDLDDETEIGDHVAFAGECIIPQCPSDLHPVLAQRIAARCLEALGDTQGLTNANTKLQEMEMKTVALIDNRVDGSPQKVVNNRGLLRYSKIRRKRWY